MKRESLSLTRVVVLGALASSLLSACGGSESPGPDAGTGGSPPASCTSSGPPRAVVLAIQGSASEIRVMTLVGGKLVDHGFHFKTGVPQFVTMREDGAEAAVAYGGYGKAYGVVTVALSPDGTTASLGEAVELGSDLTPEGLTYVSKDRLLLAASGMTTDAVITLDRGASAFAETTRVAAPGRFPIALARRGETSDAILGRLEFGVDKATTVYLLGPDAKGAYTTEGKTATIAPPTNSIGVHPGGGLLYSAATNPSDRVSPTNLEPTGLLHVLAVSDSGIVDQPTVKMPALSALVAVDPGGGALVFESPVYEIDPKNDQPTVRTYVLLTMPLDAAGGVGAAHSPSAPFKALLLNDMQVAASGHLVMAVELFPKEQPEAQSHPVEVRFQSAPGQWDVCQTLELPGASHLALAP